MFIDIDFGKETYRSSREYINDRENGAHVYEKLFAGTVVPNELKIELYDAINEKYGSLLSVD